VSHFGSGLVVVVLELFEVVAVELGAAHIDFSLGF
jgi:hypothetical protein